MRKQRSERLGLLAGRGSGGGVLSLTWKQAQIPDGRGEEGRALCAGGSPGTGLGPG